MRQVFRPMKCPCGHQACKNWFVDPVAAVQSVSFTQEQACAVANFMNSREWGQPHNEKRDGPRDETNPLGYDK